MPEFEVHESLDEYMTLFLGLLAIVNIFGVAPIFAQLTSHLSSSDRRRAANFAALFCFLVLLIFALLGNEMLSFFGISLPAFKIGGGLVILLTGLQYLGMLPDFGRSAKNEQQSVVALALVPVAIPLITGPGAISTAIIYAHLHETWTHHLIFISIILVVCIVIWAGLFCAALIAHRITPTAQMAISRIVGMILVAVGSEFIFSGAKIFA